MVRPALKIDLSGELFSADWIGYCAGPNYLCAVINVLSLISCTCILGVSLRIGGFHLVCFWCGFFVYNFNVMGYDSDTYLVG